MKPTACFWIIMLIYPFMDVKSTPKSGPYDIISNRIDSCEDMGTDEVHFGTKMSSKGNGIVMYNSDVTFSVPWDDKLKSDVEIQQLSNGVYRPRFVMQSFKNCEQMMKVAKDWSVSFFGAAGYNFTSCPLPAGKYSVKDWVMDIKFNNVPNFIYGSYKMIVSFSRDKKRVGCFVVYADAVPKKT